MKDLTTVLIIDDHPLFLEGFKAIIKTDPRLAIIGEANNGATGLKLATELHPDITITDISMPGMDGFELTRRLLTARPTAKVIILSMHTGITQISLAMQAGAAGYLVKDSSVDELLDGIIAIANNQPFIDCIVSKSFSREAMSAKVLEHYETQKAYKNLTPRERQVMHGLVKEASHRELAEKLSISTKTIENHHSNIMRKLGLKKEIELIRFGARIGLVDINF
jgi:DNA-binding NarL/FixJ family response regulator